MQMNSSFPDCHLLLIVGVSRVVVGRMNYCGKPIVPLVDCGIFKAQLNMQHVKGSRE